jgi:prenyltransferase beta subunit
MLGVDVPNKETLINWLFNRKNSLGVNGRTNKTSDSCYSFWVGATLSILGYLEIFDTDWTQQFLLNCQSEQVIINIEIT